MATIWEWRIETILLGFLRSEGLYIHISTEVLKLKLCRVTCDWVLSVWAPKINSVTRVTWLITMFVKVTNAGLSLVLGVTEASDWLKVASWWCVDSLMSLLMEIITRGVTLSLDGHSVITHGSPVQRIIIRKYQRPPVLDPINVDSINWRKVKT